MFVRYEKNKTYSTNNGIITELEIMLFVIKDVPDTELTGYPAILKAGYWISGNSRILDIRPDIRLN